MDMNFTDSFWKSLKRLQTHQSWWYKTYELFRYKIPMFFENLWFFRKQLWYFRSWDYSFNLALLKRSLEKTVHTIEFHGHEIDEIRLKKVEKIKRVIELLGNVSESRYIELAEKELGKIIIHDWDFEPVPDKTDLYKLVDNQSEEDKRHNKSVYDRAREIESEQWKEIWRILEGQDYEQYEVLLESQSEEDKKTTDFWKNWFDGSGIKHWWD